MNLASPPESGSQLGRQQVRIAAIVLLLFAALVGWVLSVAAGSSDTTWSRVMAIFTGVEAIAFAAAGAIFGTTVQAGRAASAESQAHEERLRADANVEAAQKGRAIAATLKAEGETGASAATGLRSAEAQVIDSTAARHAALASKLFPEV